MCMIEDGERAEVWQERDIRAARKEHKCCECGRFIAKGEPYHSIFMVYEKQPDSYSMCQHCAVAASWLVHNCSGYLVQAVEEDIGQHCEDGFPLSLHRLRWGMRHKWQRNGALMPLPKYPPDYV